MPFFPTSKTDGQIVGRFRWYSALGAWRRFKEERAEEAVAAAQLAEAQNISLTGDASGSAAFDGSTPATIAVTVADNSHGHVSENITDATHLNSANKIVKRDGNGNFTAGTITANLTGNAATATRVEETIPSGAINYTVQVFEDGGTGMITGHAGGFDSGNGPFVQYNITSDTNKGRFRFVSPTGTVELVDSAGNAVFPNDLTATRVYNAVWNDIVDFIDTKEHIEVQFGRVYRRERDGRHVVATDYMQGGLLGIASDTYGFGVGHKSDIQTTQLPVAIGGFVLAYCDQEYETGTPLTSAPDGGLTQMVGPDKAHYPERIIATYYRPEDEERWNGVEVDGRHWVRIR